MDASKQNYIGLVKVQSEPYLVRSELDQDTCYAIEYVRSIISLMSENDQEIHHQIDKLGPKVRTKKKRRTGI